MLFTTITYAGFLLIIFILYWFAAAKSFRIQNLILLAGSYYFYAAWDWRFLFLLCFSTFLDYLSGIQIENSASPRAKKFWLICSVGINLGFLGFFKYFNFFIDSFGQLLQSFGMIASVPTLNIILPVGISFYTFHGLSYVFDVYSGRVKSTRNVVDYALFVSFFPLLVAGPIERATHLLPQVKAPRTFSAEQASDGLRQILWGLFKKLVIADNCARIVDLVFENPGQYPGLDLAIGAVLFAFQIYCDFSGYTDIALGSARLLGFDLLRNFAYPYFSRDIAEFWRRWHISLTSWFKSYLYIPLGGNRKGMVRTIWNTLIVFLLSGLWHGANITFIIWGLYHALLFMPILLMGKKKEQSGKEELVRFTIPNLFRMILTFSLVTIGWILFRADSMSSAVEYFRNILIPHDAAKTIWDIHLNTTTTFIFIVVMLLTEWMQRARSHGLSFTWYQIPGLLRYSIYAFLIFAIIWFGAESEQFIYFQF